VQGAHGPRRPSANKWTEAWIASPGFNQESCWVPVEQEADELGNNNTLPIVCPVLTTTCAGRETQTNDSE
jgi:hypothetical protein